MDKAEKIILFVFIGVIGGCLVLSALCGGIFLITKKLTGGLPTLDIPSFETPEVEIFTPEPFKPDDQTLEPCAYPVDAEFEIVNIDPMRLNIAEETQRTLTESFIPVADNNVIYSRLNGLENVPTRLTTPPIAYQIGDSLDFYKLDEDNNHILTTASLRYATDEIYFWVEDGVYADQADLDAMMDIFANEVYPNNHDFFGTEWIPGVDNDPHLYILYAGGLGNNLAGYFSSEDYVLPVVNEYSNAHEMFVINADVDYLNDPYTLSTMAHELQHLILGYRDSNEELWLNEGFSELATLINGYDQGGFDYSFVNNPDMQLTNWSTDSDLNDLNYGASFMFTAYLASRFGEEITRDVVLNPMNGLVSLDQVFAENQLLDPDTGAVITADEFFRDWTLANYLADPYLQDGRYSYTNYDAPSVYDTEWLDSCDGRDLRKTVSQYGTDYYELACYEDFSVSFKGDPFIKILPDDSENASYFMWSDRADTSDMTLTREFDFSKINGQITLTYDAWWDLETDFDYAYLMVQVDGGAWRILNNTSCDPDQSKGNNHGCGYNDVSDGWSQETANLSEFAGQKISLRFQSISDGAISNEGFAVDNLAIPEIGYAEDFENGSGDWISEGFSRMQNLVPQAFLVTVITQNEGDPIHKYTVNPGEELVLHIQSDCLSDYPILMVSGISRFTRQTADYTLTLDQE